MRSMLTVVVLVLCSALPVRAADWFRLGDSQFTARVPVTIENPAEVDNPAVLVTADLSELGELMPAASARTLAVADDAHQLVPFQISRTGKEQLQFVVAVGAKSSKTVYIYAAKEPLQVPRFAPMTGTDIREAYRSFENEFQAYRIEVGDKANTTGLAIDLFGKTKEGHGAQLKNIYTSQYHQRQPWGIDIMKVGTGPGLGGAYIFLGDKMGRTDRKTTAFKVLYEGPVATCVEASSPAEVDGKKFTITRTIKLLAGDRTLCDKVEVKAAHADELHDLKIGIGLRDLPHQAWTEKTDAGYALVAGDGNQAGTDKLGLGVAFDPKMFVKMQELEDPANGGHIYVFTPEIENDVARITDHLMAYWDGDGWISSPEQFDALLQQYAALSKNAAKVEIGKIAEKR